MSLISLPVFDINMIVVISIFIATYALLLIFSDLRAYIAAGAALVYVVLGLFGVIPFSLFDAWGGIEWNVLLMIFGTMGLVALFIESKMPSLLADKIIEWSPNLKWAIIGLAVFSGVISAFVDNVATVLMVAPIALTVCKKLKVSPVPAIIAIAVFSNIEGAATLVGDTTSIMLGASADLNFFDFFFTQGHFSIFWIVQAGLLAATVVLFVIFRKEKQKMVSIEKTVVTDYVPSILMISIVVLLIIASFIPNAPALINGYICVGLMLIGIIWKMISKKKFAAIKETVKEIDFLTLLMLAGIFIIVAALVKVGIINWIGDAIGAISGGNAFLAYSIILWGSVLISAFIDNIPYVAMMLGVVSIIAQNLNVNPSVFFINPLVFYFALLAGATLGGNLTPIGASANIAGIGILRKAGFKVKTWDFMRIGLPATLAAVGTAYILIWVIWAH